MRTNVVGLNLLKGLIMGDSGGFTNVCRISSSDFEYLLSHYAKNKQTHCL